MFLTTEEKNRYPQAAALIEKFDLDIADDHEQRMRMAFRVKLTEGVMDDFNSYRESLQFILTRGDVSPAIKTSLEICQIAHDARQALIAGKGETFLHAYDTLLEYILPPPTVSMESSVNSASAGILAQKISKMKNTGGYYYSPLQAAAQEHLADRYERNIATVMDREAYHAYIFLNESYRVDALTEASDIYQSFAVKDKAISILQKAWYVATESTIPVRERRLQEIALKGKKLDLNLKT